MYWIITARYKDREDLDIKTVKANSEKQAIALYHTIRSKDFKIISCARN